jgi:acyl-coenzyme A synthetase/AMP-(fatty) acid ligase
MLVPFLNPSAGEMPALIDDHSEGWCSYNELSERGLAWARRLSGAKSLVLLAPRNRVDDIACVLGALASGHAVALIDPAISKDRLAVLILEYAPDFIIFPKNGQLVVEGQANSKEDIAADNALLLSTSGSTGSPKFARLTLQSVISNAHAIAQSLLISPDDTGSGHLQVHYSYGLSVLSSHLVVGASVALTETSFTDGRFWRSFRDRPITQLPGVPFHYEMMLKLGLRRLPLENVNVLTQAGGFLDVEARQMLWQFMNERGGRFHVMYGQTEAAPRMTTLAHEQFPEAPQSVGVSLDGGAIEIHDEHGALCDIGVPGIVRYRGPNVMLGYAVNRSDLALGDTQNGMLETGDLGWLDSKGRLTLTGRAKRFGKVYGLRVGLDEVERLLSGISKFVVMQRSENELDLITESPVSDEIVTDARNHLKQHFNIPASVYRFHFIEAIAYTARNKVDYAAMEKML